MKRKVASEKPAAQAKASASGKSEVKREVVIPHRLTVKQLADVLGVSAIDVIKCLMRNGIMASINQVIDYETAAIVATDLGYEAKAEPQASLEAVPRPRFAEGHMGRRGTGGC